jgi:hypothetical protein
MKGSVIAVAMQATATGNKMDILDYRRGAPRRNLIDRFGGGTRPAAHLPYGELRRESHGLAGKFPGPEPA